MSHLGRRILRTSAILVGLTLLGVAALAAPVPPSQEAKPRVPTFRESLEFRSARSPVISPDGSFVLYSIRELDWEDNGYGSHLWLADLKRGTNRRLTFGDATPRQPAWDPRGRWISFLRSTEGVSQLHLLDPAGGEAWSLSEEKEAVGSYAWSPDGKSIAFTRSEENPYEDRQGAFFQVDEPSTPRHLWRIAVPDERGGEHPAATRLTDGSEHSIQSFSWSPDSKRIAVSATAAPSYSWDTSDIFVLDVQDSVSPLTAVVERPSPDWGPIWSPDGESLAFQTSNGAEFFYYANSEIAVISSSGGEPTILTESFDENPDLIRWSRDNTIYFSALDRTAAHLYGIDPENRSIRQVSSPDPGMYWSFSMDDTGKRIAFVGASPNEIPEIHWTDLDRFEPKPFTDNEASWAPFVRGQYEVVSWKSRDGALIEGVLVKPADFDPSRRYPLLVQIHGGPQGIDRPLPFPDRTYPTQHFLAKGALILRPNYRGSAGYGSRFRALNVRNLGVGDRWDVESGVDFLVSKGWVDPKRVGTMGWSQGGYISAFLATSSSRFSAASVGAGISDWMTYYVNTDIHPFTRQYLKATPWDDPEIYRKTSPISYVQTAKTPTLIQHGENDRRVPIPNAYQLYQALQDRRVPVEMYVFKGFGHGINRPLEQVALMEQNYRWFCRWIWGEEDPAIPGRKEEL